MKFLDTKQLDFEKDSPDIKSFIGSKNLLTNKRTQWKFHRKIMEPLWSEQKLGEFFLPKIQETCKKYIKKISNLCAVSDATTMNVSKEFPLYTFDATTAILFGNLDSSAEINAAYLSGIYAQSKYEEFIKIPILKYLPGMITGISEVQKQKSIIAKRIKELLESTNNSNSSFINILSLAKDSENNTSLSYEEIVDNVLSFYHETYETVSSVIVYACYYFITYNTAFKELQAEVDSILKSNNDASQITLEHVQNMPNLQAFVKEILRVHPSIPILSRISIADTKISDIAIPKNTHILLLLETMQTDTFNWEKGSEFIPSRWTSVSEAKSATNYIPFSTGPRNCIGKFVARTEILILLALLLKNFDMRPGTRNITLDTKQENSIPSKILVHFTKRKLN